MNTLPIPLPHKVTIRKGGERWHAVCSCGTWHWRSRSWRLALWMTQGHLINQSGKAA